MNGLKVPQAWGELACSHSFRKYSIKGSHEKWVIQTIKWQPITVGVALPLAGSVDIVMHVIVWHVGGRIDVFFVLLRGGLTHN